MTRNASTKKHKKISASYCLITRPTKEVLFWRETRSPFGTKGQKRISICIRVGMDRILKTYRKPGSPE